MALNVALLAFAIVFLPGILWAQMDAKYAAKTKPSPVEFLLRCFLFGLVAYAVLFLVYKGLGWEFSAEIASNLSDSSGFAVFIDEILLAVPVSLVLGVGWVSASNRKWLASLLQRVGATKRYGDEDVWDFTFNSPIPAVEYVHVRDFEKELLFAGWVETFSETDRLRELVIRDVQVFSFSSGAPIYEVPRMYIARKPDDITIEFPFREVTANG